jgi:hypothetical protein
LLRYFVTDKIVDFHERFRKAFPHLDNTVTEQDLALVVNLWEDNRHLLVSEGGSGTPVKAPPRTFGGETARPQAKAAHSAPTPARAAHAPHVAHAAKRSKR